MELISDIFFDALRNAVLISGLVVVMMMLIESMNITSRGDFFKGLKKSRIGQILVSAALGVLPGCMGGFASVSLFTHGIISFGALVAMMVASSGDEAFVMIAMMPEKAWWIFLLLFVLAVVCGIVVDAVCKPSQKFVPCCEPDFAIHEEDAHHHGGERHVSAHRVIMFLGVVAFLVALLSGLLEHDEGHGAPETAGGINLLSEEWMYWLFGGFSLIVLAVLVFGEDHFVDDHLWKHIVCTHLPSVFAWTFGVLLLLGFGLNYLDIGGWINSNTALMVVLATLVGIIPESGPHLVFVTLYASGVVPFPVLLASCISQDGHASLPLLAESKSAFVRAKAINCLFALLAGFAAMLLV
ncbi:MAG: putative manganese transporter [Bacteroidales bacterium]|nr:putative manganese transporter [Bacteroidales bacterium]